MSNRREFLLQAAVSGLGLTASNALGASGKASVATRGHAIPNTDLIVSRLGYGVAMSSVNWRSPDLIDRTVENLRVAYQSGITFFDAADTYGGAGRSEAALGEFLKRSPGVRDNIVIQSKCGVILPDGWVPGDPIKSSGFGVDLSRKHILNSVEGSLKRIGTDRLDILLLHVPHALVDPQQIAQAFDELKDSGKVRYFGISNHNALQIELLKQHVRYPLVTNQILLSLAYYAPISDSSSFGALVDYCRLHGVQVQAFSPLRGPTMIGRPILLSPPADASDEMREVAQMLVDISKNHGVSAAAIMLAWLLKHPAGIIPIIGASKPEHIIDNRAAIEVELTTAEWNALFNAARPIQPKR